MFDIFLVPSTMGCFRLTVFVVLPLAIYCKLVAQYNGKLFVVWQYIFLELRDSTMKGCLVFASTIDNRELQLIYALNT